MVDVARHVTPSSAPLDSAFRVRVRRSAELARNVLANPTTVLGLVMIVAMIGMALLAPWITEPNQPNPYQMPRDWGALSEPPGTPGFPLGTTSTGGDVLYGISWGARTSLRLSLIVVGITVGVGVVVGSVAGVRGGRVDEFLMRIAEEQFRLCVGKDDDAALIGDDERVRRVLDDRAKEGVGEVPLRHLDLAVMLVAAARTGRTS